MFIIFTGSGSFITDDPKWVNMTDRELVARDIVTIDRWSESLGDYVEARRAY